MARVKGPGQRLTPDEQDRIIDLRLNRVPVRAISEQIPCSPTTVNKVWHDWLDETTEERRTHLERKRSEVIGRLDSVATLARRAAVRSRGNNDPISEAKFLTEERQALSHLSRIAGWDAPTKIATSFTQEMSDEEAAKILAELDDLGI